jgi:hypothetical protein
LKKVLHRHHITPRHAGGTDDPDNLVELTLEEHAEAHKLLFEKYGRWQDHLAWKGLSGQIGKDEIIIERRRSQTYRTGEAHQFFGKTHPEETKKKMSEYQKKAQHGKYERTPQTIEKLREYASNRSLEHKKKLYKTQLRNARKKMIDRLDREFKKYWDNCKIIATLPNGNEMRIRKIATFANRYGLWRSHIYKVLKGELEHYKGYKFRYC